MEIILAVPFYLPSEAFLLIVISGQRSILAQGDGDMYAVLPVSRKAGEAWPLTVLRCVWNEIRRLLPDYPRVCSDFFAAFFRYFAEEHLKKKTPFP